MPRLGYESVGATVLLGSAGDHDYNLLPAMSEDGTLDSVSFYVRDGDDVDRRSIFFIADSSGNILGQSAAFQAGDQVWATRSDLGAVSLTSGQQYIIGMLRENIVGRPVYDTGQPGFSIETDSGTWSTVNDPVVSESTISDARLSAYLDYTSLGGVITSVSGDNVITSGEQDAAVVKSNFAAITTATYGGVNIFSGWDEGASTQDFPALPDAVTNPVSRPDFGSNTYELGDGTLTADIAVTENVPADYNRLVYTAAPTDVDTQIGAGLSLTGGDSVAINDSLSLHDTTLEDATLVVAASGTAGNFTITGGSYDPDITYTIPAYLFDESRDEMWFVHISVRNSVIVGTSVPRKLFIGIRMGM